MARDITWRSRVSGSVGSSLCNNERWLADDRPSSGVWQSCRAPEGSHMFEGLSASHSTWLPGLGPGLGSCVPLRLQLLNLMLARIMLCDGPRNPRK